MRLKELCRFPPPPDAICFEHVDHSESRHIYKDSPLFEVIFSGLTVDDPTGCCRTMHPREMEMNLFVWGKGQLLCVNPISDCLEHWAVFMFSPVRFLSMCVC